MPVQNNYFDCEWGGGACAFSPQDVRQDTAVNTIRIRFSFYL